MGERTAIYRPFPQAVPSRFTIDKRGISPCKAACPAETSAQGYVALIAEGRYEDALDVITRHNPFPATVGRVCTHPCEAQCNRGKLDKPVAICALKRFVADTVYAQREVQGNKGRAVPPPAPAGGGRVAIVGAGPAGLSAAHFLARAGHRVTIFEALPVAGGMMRVGIPAYRLPRDVLQREIDNILDLGVELRLGSPVTDLQHLFDEGYQAVFLGIGAHEPIRLRIPGEDAEGVYHGIEFLRSVNLEEPIRVGKRVVVIGGGNTAIDAARSALRLGAEEVIIAYRRSRTEMPANVWEVEEAEREGVKLELLVQPVEILSKDRRLTGIRCVRMRLGEPDASGRRSPIPIEGSEFIIPADTVIAAVAQAPQTTLLGADHGLTVTRQGAFAVDPATLQTKRPGVFAGGDARRGPGALIEAIADGRKAARSIDRFLRGEPLILPEDINPLPVVELSDEQIAGLLQQKGVNVEQRQAVSTAPVSERVRDFREVEVVFSEEQARAEALRCLRCGVCSECHQCEKACGPGAIRHRMTDEIIEVDVGAIVMATGYQLYPKAKIGEYGYGVYKDVLDGLQFERLLSASGPTGGEIRRPSDGKVPETIVFIQCVGSRDPAHGVPYCSKICCMYSAKHAILYKHRVHNGQAYVFYMDNRTAGKNYDEFGRRAIEEEGAIYLRGRVSRVFEKDGKLIVRGADTLAGTQVEIEADMVVLAMALTPQPDSARLANKVGISYDLHGFFNEAHPKLRPIETNTAGIFLAGTCQAPRDIPETVAQGTAAAGKVLQLLAGDQYVREPLIASVDASRCNACFFCQAICPYDAIEEQEIPVRVNGVRMTRVVARANEGKCMGCGACVAACPSKAIMVRGFTDQQIFEEVIHAI
ncbi:MAG: FAD-dependent oxidoreductase [Chloroflexi bacterium]|nr:FAD-dependent oxidoreductase [Chloroflexota bacterium]